jgi:hypothetical protein
MLRGVGKHEVEAMCDFRSFRLLWNVIERCLEQYSVTSERLNQLSRVSEGHYCDLIDRFETIDCFTGGAMCFVAPYIDPIRAYWAPIDSHHHRERQLILAEVCDLLFDSIFVGRKSSLFKPPTMRALFFCSTSASILTRSTSILTTSVAHAGVGVCEVTGLAE